MSKDDTKGRVAIGAVFGIVAGFLTGLLTAPKSGKETRKDIKKTAERITDNTEKELKSLYRSLTAHSDAIRKDIEKAVGKGKSELEALLTKVDGSRDKIKELLSAIRDGGTDDKIIDRVLNQANKVGEELKNKRSSKK